MTRTPRLRRETGPPPAGSRSGRFHSAPPGLWAAAALLLLASAPASAAVSNGSFEDPAITGRGSIGQLSDWTATGGFMLLERGPNGISGLAAHDGEQFVSFGHSGFLGGRLSQVIATVAGRLYELEYYVTGVQGAANSVQDIVATVSDGLTGGPLAAFTSVIDYEDTWTRQALTFTAVGSSTEIAFQHLTGTRSGSGANVALDAVSVSQVGGPPGGSAVPEPASAGLCLLAGLGLVGGGLRRRLAAAI